MELKNMMNFFRIIVWVNFIALFAACKSSVEYHGASMKNYPDLANLVQSELLPFEKDPYSFKLITRSEKGTDSNFLKASEIKWDEWNEPLQKSDIYKKEFDNQYSISVTEDTIASTLTLVYTTLNSSNFVQKMTLTRSAAGDEIKHIYIEAREVGMSESEELKIIFVPGKMIQLVEQGKKAFAKNKRQVRSLYFLN
ncbi:MAG TPA: hypothetical protein PLU10_01925 [Chitinophagaceae bacterium]|nr:hypothetical protein [Chitinophagaceae bacterium]